MAKRYPGVRLHASTQLGVHSADGARLAKDLGFDQVILSRETDLKTISEIARIIDTEVFVHGALCVSFSGNCYLSSRIFSSSGNRGACLQPCRKAYAAMQGGRETGRGYLLSTSDLRTGEEALAFSEAGVKCFKIEGRMRRPEYVAAATRFYRKVIDGEPVSREDYTDLAKIYNRGGFTKGYALGGKNLMFKDVQGHLGVFAGKIKSVHGQTALAEFSVPPQKGDAYKLLRKKAGGIAEVGNAAYAGESRNNLYSVNLRGQASPGDMLHLTSDTAQLKELADIQKRIPLDISCEAAVGKPFKVTLGVDMDLYAFQHLGERRLKRITVTAGGELVQPSRSAPLSVSQIEKLLCKLGDTQYFCGELSCSVEEDIFLPVSAVNAAKRQAIALLDSEIEKLANPSCIILCKKPVLHSTMQDRSFKNAAIVSDNGLKLETASLFSELIFSPYDYTESAFRNFFDIYGSFAGEKHLALPVFLRPEDAELAERRLSSFNFDGIYAENISHIRLAQRLNLKVFGGIGLNTFNSLSAKVLNGLAYDCKFTLSSELSLTEQDSLIGGMDASGAYVCVYGDLDAMTLAHCPVKNVYGCECSDCKYFDDLKYRDEKGADFAVKRKRMNSCVFVLKNSLPFFALNKLKRQNVNFLFDFTGSDEAEAEKIMEYYAEKFMKGNAPTDLKGYTSGNLLRSV